MRLYLAEFEVLHPSYYRPSGHTTGTVTKVFWDEDEPRLCAELLYKNGAIDWIPVIELVNPKLVRLSKYTFNY